MSPSEQALPAPGPSGWGSAAIARGTACWPLPRRGDAGAPNSQAAHPRSLPGFRDPESASGPPTALQTPPSVPKSRDLPGLTLQAPLSGPDDLLSNETKKPHAAKRENAALPPQSCTPRPPKPRPWRPHSTREHPPRALISPLGRSRGTWPVGGGGPAGALHGARSQPRWPPCTAGSTGPRGPGRVRGQRRCGGSRLRGRRVGCAASREAAHADTLTTRTNTQPIRGHAFPHHTHAHVAKTRVHPPHACTQALAQIPVQTHHAHTGTRVALPRRHAPPGAPGAPHVGEHTPRHAQAHPAAPTPPTRSDTHEPRCGGTCGPTPRPRLGQARVGGRAGDSSGDDQQPGRRWTAAGGHAGRWTGGGTRVTWWGRAWGSLGHGCGRRRAEAACGAGGRVWETATHSLGAGPRPAGQVASLTAVPVHPHLSPSVPGLLYGPSVPRRREPPSLAPSLPPGAFGERPSRARPLALSPRLPNAPTQLRLDPILACP